jgi:hypothetical protein
LAGSLRSWSSYSPGPEQTRYSQAS